MDASFIQYAARIARVPFTLDSSVTIEGSDPVHPSPLRLGDGTAALLGMIGASVDDIWHAQTGRRQRIRIDHTHAALGISSAWLLRVNGELAFTALRSPTSFVDGSYLTADGRTVRLMTGTFLHLATPVLELLDCPDEPDAIAAAVARWSAADLEAALTARGMTGVIVREHAEWLEHPQGRFLHESPAVEITRIGDAPARALPGGDRPLSGLRVLDATRVIAGPTIARTLAEFGADVLHVESPNIPDGGATRADTGHGKLQSFVDLATDEGRATMAELARTADVFSQSYRAGSMAARGFGPEAVAALNPGIIYVSETAYGHGGPWHEKRGFDGNVQSASGIEMLNRRAAPPSPVAMAMNDYGTGYWGAFGVLQALKRRAVEGGSWHVKVALGQTASWYLRLGAPHDPSRAKSADELYALADQYSEAHDSDYGLLRRLRPIIQLSETPSSWERRTALPGSHPAAWPAPVAV
ncbi:MAG TPA: CoA transferase [Tepidiformaceae bacterium]|nr:CoA transferase [Tepidiformaceae bacterium]